MLNPADTAFLATLAARLPEGSLRPAEARYLEEPRGRWHGLAGAVALPRTTEQVAFDVAAGLVTIDGARRYGVVITKSGEVEAGATEALRAQMRGKRGPKKIFDRGFESIEELKARYKAETGFEPPRTPVFTKWAKVAAEAMLAKELAAKKLATKTLVTKKKRRKAA